MSCAPSDRILQTLRVHVPGAPDTLLELELFNVMDTFFRRTSAWRFESIIDLQQGVNEYGFGTPGNTTVVRLMGITQNSMPVPPASAVTGQIQSNIGTLVPSQIFPDGDVLVPYEISDMNASHVFSYAIYRPNYIQIVGTVDSDAVQYPLDTITALTLTTGCLECADCGDWSVEDWMWDAFFGDWLAGTLGALYGMPSKPWSNPQLAMVFEKRFRNKMAYRKQEAVRGFSWNVPAWSFPRWV